MDSRVGLCVTGLYRCRHQALHKHLTEGNYRQNVQVKNENAAHKCVRKLLSNSEITGVRPGD